MSETPRESTTDTPDPPRVRDRRLILRGGLPRQIQTWLMIGVAVVILLIILITGHPQPPGAGALPDRSQAAALAAPDRIKGFEQQLSDDEARLREMTTRTSIPDRVDSRVGLTNAVSGWTPDRSTNADFASDNVAFSRRPGATSRGTPSASAGSSDPTGDAMTELDALEGWLKAMTAAMPTGVAPTATQPVPGPPLVSLAPSPPIATPPPPSDPSRTRLVEGTVIEAVLLNRLDGTYTGPVTALVTSPVYSLDRQSLVIPAGSRVIGRAAAVQSWGDARLALSFHRLMTPNGQTYSLDRFSGLSQIGETGLQDRVNRHYAQVFGASLAVGALSGLAQLETRAGVTMSFADGARQGAGSSLANSATRILDRYLNVLPTITIREGYRLKVYLTSDLELPPYAPLAGGAR